MKSNLDWCSYRSLDEISLHFGDNKNGILFPQDRCKLNPVTIIENLKLSDQPYDLFFYCHANSNFTIDC